MGLEPFDLRRFPFWSRILVEVFLALTMALLWPVFIAVLRRINDGRERHRPVRAFLLDTLGNHLVYVGKSAQQNRRPFLTYPTALTGGIEYDTASLTPR
jgi:hypothetical protein